MKITTDKVKSIKSLSAGHKLTEAIKNKLKERKEDIGKKVDLSRIAKDLAARREKVLAKEVEIEKEEESVK